MHRFLVTFRKAEEIKPAVVTLTFKEETLLCYGDLIINEFITNHIITLPPPG